MNEQSTVQPSKPSDEQIAQRAYCIWAQEGFIHGRDVEYWLRAEAELVAAGSPKGLNAAIAEVLAPLGKEAKRQAQIPRRDGAAVFRGRPSAQARAQSASAR